MSLLTAEDKAELDWECFRAAPNAKPKTAEQLNKQRIAKARREATATDKKMYQDNFIQAKKDEVAQWFENEVLELVDMRKHRPNNFVTGRWVLTVKRDKNGKFMKTKARWVLRGFLDRQKTDLQTDSPTSSRPGFRMLLQLGANRGWDINHMDLKTAFLQG